MERFIERGDEFENSGFGEDSTLKPAQRRRPLRPTHSLQRFMEAEHAAGSEFGNCASPKPFECNEVFEDDEFENVATIRRTQHTGKRAPASHALRSPLKAAIQPRAATADIDFEDGFEFDGEPGELKLRISPFGCPTRTRDLARSPSNRDAEAVKGASSSSGAGSFGDGFSDFETTSPSRHSRASSSATSLSDYAETLDDDADFELDEGPGDLIARFKARELRARLESNNAGSTNNTMKSLRRHIGPYNGHARTALLQSCEDDGQDDFDGLDLGTFDPARARNVVYGSLRLPVRSQSRQELAYTLRQPAQQQQQAHTRDDLAAWCVPSTPRRTIRPAKSMYEIATRARSRQDDLGQLGRINSQLGDLGVSARRLQPSASSRRPLRDLARYAEEPVKPPRDFAREREHAREREWDLQPKRGKDEQSQPWRDERGLLSRRRRAIGLIRNVHGSLAPKTHDGMVLDPVSGMWLGNDADSARFDAAMVAPRTVRIPHSQTAAVDGMVFDSVNLCWVPQSGGKLHDPFESLDDLSDDWEPTNLQPRGVQNSALGERGPSRVSSSFTASTEASRLGSSFRAERSELASQDTFEVSAAHQRAWADLDLRFMRKFGRWISGEGELNAAAYDIYKMVH